MMLNRASPSYNASSLVVEIGDEDVTWEWRKRGNSMSDDIEEGAENEEWKSYAVGESRRIEQAYQSGIERCRLKRATTFVEIFLYDEVQYCPFTAAQHDIRRLGNESIFQKSRRLMRSFLYLASTGSFRHKSFIAYKKQIKRREQEKKNFKETFPRSEFCKRLVDSYIFSFVSMFLILVNTVLLGFDAEYNTAESSSSTQHTFHVIDHCFCSLFVCELFIVFMSKKRRRTFKKLLHQISNDRWFMFDLSMVLLMVVETWLLPLLAVGSESLNQVSTLRLLRILRMTRLIRIARLLRFFPEILIMIKSILAAVRSVACAFLVLLMLLYVFAILFKTRAEGTELEELFPSISQSMWNLLVYGAFMDELGDMLSTICAGDPALATLFLGFVFLSNLTVLNMLIGVICEVASDVSKREGDMIDRKTLKADLNEFLDLFDTDEDHEISLREFELLLNNSDVRIMLAKHGVDWYALSECKDDLFENHDVAQNDGDPETLSGTASMSQKVVQRIVNYDHLVELMLRFKAKSGGGATMLDMISLKRTFQVQLNELKELFTSHMCSGQTNFATEIAINSNSTKGMLHKESHVASHKAVGEVQLNDWQTARLNQPLLEEEMTAQERLPSLDEEKPEVKDMTILKPPSSKQLVVGSKQNSGGSSLVSSTQNSGGSLLVPSTQDAREAKRVRIFRPQVDQQSVSGSDEVIKDMLQCRLEQCEFDVDMDSLDIEEHPGSIPDNAGIHMSHSVKPSIHPSPGSLGLCPTTTEHESIHPCIMLPPVPPPGAPHGRI